ncbi:MAG: TatD family hydrolase [Acholeplasma sp.]|nr:TatD family hydrolase [Acholeplasma sp.]
MIDTHAHLNIEEYENDIDEVLFRAHKSGVNRIVVVGMDYETSLKAIDLSNEYQGLYATVGVHPGYVNECNHESLDRLYGNNKVLAVGEIGLDYYWQDDNRELQERVFEEQVVKAINLKLPIIVHTRNSFNEAFNIVSKYQGKVTGVFHCFSSNLEDAIKTVEMGFYIGIDGPITFKNNMELERIVKNINLDRILIETDSPYLTPVPYRGKRNEPSNVLLVAKKIAEIKRITIDEVIKQTTANAVALFNIKE